MHCGSISEYFYNSFTLRSKFSGMCHVRTVFDVSEGHSASIVRVKRFNKTWTALVLFIISPTAVKLNS
jgi:hypothetical protein